MGQPGRPHGHGECSLNPGTPVTTVSAVYTGQAGEVSYVYSTLRVSRRMSRSDLVWCRSRQYTVASFCVGSILSSPP